MKIKNVVIIYNPSSTGDSPTMAKRFAATVHKQLPDIKVAVMPTEYAGHAEELAYQAAIKTPNVLLVSVSGDGGFNEVINGAARAINVKRATPICAVLPGGNANDHYNSVKRRPLITTIKENAITEFDLLQVTFGKTSRYAHSYAGLGLTPLVATELNRHKLNKLRETWLALKTYWSLRPFTIERNGTTHQIDSLLFILIDRMAKHLTLAPDNHPANGHFEFLCWPHGNKIELTATIIKSILNRPVPHEQMKEYSFKTVQKMPMQLDGELLELPKSTNIKITIAPKKLRTLL